MIEKSWLAKNEESNKAINTIILEEHLEDWAEQREEVVAVGVLAHVLLPIPNTESQPNDPLNMIQYCLGT